MFDEQGRKIATSKHLEGISDLTVAAPIRDGFVPAFETITYEGRVRLVMKALFRLRSASREYETLKPFADSAERIQSLRSFRLGILPGNPATLVLAATFDRAWEPYMRLIWSPLGPMLDVIFCNCEGYVTARDHSFAAYAEWVRRHQVDADFFYASTALSVADLSYLSEAERKMRELGPDAEPDLASLTAVDPVVSARSVQTAHKFATDLLAMDVLRAMYRLADYYPHDRVQDHGKFLIRATKGLLGDEWRPENLKREFQLSLAKEIAWLKTPVEEEPKPAPSSAVPVPGEVQMGILAPYDSAEAPITHGGLMLLQITDAGKARRFIADLKLSWEDGTCPEDGIFVNLAFSRRGLEEIGVPDEQLDQFPKEFEEGMEARAGLLGDVRDHHPRRWRLPKRWVPDTPISYEMISAPDKVDVEIVSSEAAGSEPAIPLRAQSLSDPAAAAAAAGAPRPPAMNVGVDLSEVDLVIQLRVHAPHHQGHEIADHPDHPLHAKVIGLAGDPQVTGVRLLAVEIDAPNLVRARPHARPFRLPRRPQPADPAGRLPALAAGPVDDARHEPGESAGGRGCGGRAAVRIRQ